MKYLEGNARILENGYGFIEKQQFDYEAEYLEGLVEKIQAAENEEAKREAFAFLIQETQDRISSLSFHLMGSHHDAQEVVQETYLRAWVAIDNFRADAKVTTWLHRITVNTAMTHLGKRSHWWQTFKAQAPSEDLEINRTNITPDEEADMIVDRLIITEEIGNGLTNLTHKQREVVLLNFYGVSHEEIAETLGISITSSKVTLHRARKKLQKLLRQP